jgi:vesicle-fusing ATPase
LQALSEVKPAFGVSEDTLERCMSNGIIDYGPEFARLLYTGNMFIDQVRNSDRTPLVSVLLEGIIGSGKTAISAKLAMESNFPYVKMITPDDLVGYQESSKVCLLD